MGMLLDVCPKLDVSLATNFIQLKSKTENNARSSIQTRAHEHEHQHTSSIKQLGKSKETKNKNPLA